MMRTPRQLHKGFTLLVAVVLSSVALSIGIALLDIALKQVVLASAAKQSQKAFYAADSVMECILYYDQQLNTFDNANEPTSGTITCNTATATFAAPIGPNPRVTTITVPCPGGAGQVLGMATVYKTPSAVTQIFATGYNTCDASNPRRIERGLKVTY